MRLNLEITSKSVYDEKTDSNNVEFKFNPNNSPAELLTVLEMNQNKIKSIVFEYVKNNYGNPEKLPTKTFEKIYNTPIKDLT